VNPNEECRSLCDFVAFFCRSFHLMIDEQSHERHNYSQAGGGECYPQANRTSTEITAESPRRFHET
jgi:hypothetical protein